MPEGEYASDIRDFQGAWVCAKAGYVSKSGNPRRPSKTEPQVWDQHEAQGTAHFDFSLNIQTAGTVNSRKHWPNSAGFPVGFPGFLEAPF